MLFVCFASLLGHLACGLVVQQRKGMMPLGLQRDGHPPWTATVLVGGGGAQPGPLHVPNPAVSPRPQLDCLLPDPFPAQEPCGQDPAPPGSGSRLAGWGQQDMKHPAWGWSVLWGC